MIARSVEECIDGPAAQKNEDMKGRNYLTSLVDLATGILVESTSPPPSSSGDGVRDTLLIASRSTAMSARTGTPLRVVNRPSSRRRPPAPAAALSSSGTIRRSHG